MLEVVPVDVGVKRQLLSPSPSFEDYTDVNLSSDDTLVSFGDCGSDASYASSRSSGIWTALSATPEPMRGNPYIRHEATNSSLESRTRTLETNGKRDASYSKDLHSLLAPRFSTYEEPTHGHAYIRREAPISSPVSRSRTLETNANGKLDASCGKGLHWYALLKRVWCLSDAYTHIATA